MEILQSFLELLSGGKFYFSTILGLLSRGTYELGLLTQHSQKHDFVEESPKKILENDFKFRDITPHAFLQICNAELIFLTISSRNQSFEKFQNFCLDRIKKHIKSPRKWNLRRKMYRVMSQNLK